MNMKRSIFLYALVAIGALWAQPADACTGIAFTAKDGSRVVARTVEWAATPMDCGYAIVPRGQVQTSYTPTGANGLKFKARYGYAGIYTEYESFVVEGLNEKGLSAGLFFFPQYGSYPAYDASANDLTLCDMQFVPWVLSQFSCIDEVKEGLKNVRLVTLDSKIGAVHWRISEPGGRMVVLEFVDGEPHFYENPLGVLTNAPGFQWHLANLNNYVNLYSGAAQSHDIASGVTLKQFGGGSGMLGLPGDFTPPSRFVRATFLQTTAPEQPTGFAAVTMAFHVLNNFDIPVGMQFQKGDAPSGMQSATQVTSASDQQALRLYYRTGFDSTIRCIDLKAIDFSKVKMQHAPLDPVRTQPVEMIKIS